MTRLREVPWSFRLGVESWTDFPTSEKSLVTKTNRVKSRLSWAGHVICQDDDDLSRRVLLSEPGGKRPEGDPGCVGKMEWRKM